MKAGIIRLTACLAAVLAILALVVVINGAGTPRANAEEGVKYITGNIDITFDEKRIFLSEQLTGGNVTDALKYAGITNFGYDYEGPSPDGWYVDSGNYYTCLVEVDKYNPTDPSYWSSLAYTENKISKANKYYLRICIERYSSDGYSFDINHLPTIKVNGKAPEIVDPRGEQPDYIDVYVPLEYHEDYKMVWSAGPKYDRFAVQRGTSKQLIPDIGGNDTRAVWTLVDAQSSGTSVTPDGLLTVGNDEVGFFEVRCASAAYPEIGRNAEIHVSDEPVAVTDIMVFHNAKDGVGYRSQWVNFDAIVHGTEFSDVVWSLRSTLGDPDSGLDGSGSLYIAREEPATSVTVRATSAFDSTKYGEFTLEIKEPRKLSGTIAVTYDEGIVTLNDAYSGFDITSLLLDPEAGKVSRLGYERAKNGWYIDPNPYCTHLAVDNGDADPFFWDRLYYDTEEPLDPDREYYLVFEIENDIDAGYEWDMKNLPAFTVNGKAPDYIYKSGDDGGYCDLYVRVKSQKQQSVTLSGLIINMPPQQTIYFPGDAFDSEGIRVLALYSDGSTSDATEKTTFSPDGALTAANKSVTVSFTADGVTKSVQQPVEIVSPDEYYILTFDSYGGSYVPAQAVRKGEKPVRPADPVKKHLTLRYWISLLDWNDLDFSKPLSASTKVRAFWVCDAAADVYPKGSGEVCPRNYGYGSFAEHAEYSPDEYEYGSGGFIVNAKDGYVFKEWRLGSPDGELITTDETLPYFVLRENPSDLIFRTTDGGYKFFAIFEAADSVTLGPTDVPDVTVDPGTTDGPAVTAVPGTTDGPDVTAEPGATDGPDVTAEPGGSGEPAATGSGTEPIILPGDTTPAPEATNSGNSNNNNGSGGKDSRRNSPGGVPVWVLILIAVAALGIGAGVTVLIIKLQKKK